MVKCVFGRDTHAYKENRLKEDKTAVAIRTNKDLQFKTQQWVFCLTSKFTIVYSVGMKKQSTTKKMNKRFAKPSLEAKYRAIVKDIIDSKKTKSSIATILKNHGYSKAVQNSPQKVTKTQTFQELMTEMIPDDYIVKKHNQLLENKVMLQMHFPETLSDEEIREVLEPNGFTVTRIITSEVEYPSKKGGEPIVVVKRIAYYSAPNGMVQDRALDKLYKLRGDYAPEKREVKHEGFTLEQLYKGEYED